MSWRRDLTGAHNPAAVVRRRAYLKTLRPKETQTIELALLPQAQTGRQLLVAENARPFQGRLDFITEVRLSTSMSGLLKLADMPGNDPRLVRQRLEALMTFDASAGMHELERRSSYAHTKRRLDEFNRRFSAKFFDGSATRQVWSSHDVNDHYHVTRVTETDPGPKRTRHVIRHTLFCRLMRFGADELVPVVFDYRLKNRFDEYNKVQKQYDDRARRANAFQVHDRCGLRLVVPDEAYVERALEALIEFLQEPELGASIIEVPNPHMPTRDPQNHHTDKRFAVSKLTVAVGEQFFEIQIQSLGNWLATRTATDGVNHDMYRLFQCLDVYFPLMFPPAVYGVDWTDRAVRDELTSWKIRSLGLLADVRIARNR